MAINVTDIKVSELDNDDRLLYEAGMIDADKFITSAGWDMLKVVMVRKHKQEFVNLVKKVNASKEPNNTT